MSQEEAPVFVLSVSIEGLSLWNYLMLLWKRIKLGEVNIDVPFLNSKQK